MSTTTIESMRTLRRLWIAEKDPGRAKQLEEEYSKAFDAFVALAPQGITDSDRQALNKAITGLEQSIGALEKAIKDEQEVANAINRLATIVSAFVEVAKAVRPTPF